MTMASRVTCAECGTTLYKGYASSLFNLGQLTSADGTQHPRPANKEVEQALPRIREVRTCDRCGRKAIQKYKGDYGPDLPDWKWFEGSAIPTAEDDADICPRCAKELSKWWSKGQPKSSNHGEKEATA